MSEEKKAEPEGTAPTKEADKTADKGKAYLVTYNGDYQDVTVEAFASKELAVEASGKSPKEKGLVVQETSDLTQYTIDDLLRIYNGVNGTSLTRFRTLESGRERILTSVKAMVSVDDDTAPSGASDEASSNQGESDMAAKKATKKKAAPKAPAERKKRKSQVDADKKIQHTEKFKDVKLRDGAARGEDFKKMKNGTKVSTYLENGGSGANIRFALQKGYIKLTSE